MTNDKLIRRAIALLFFLGAAMQGSLAQGHEVQVTSPDGRIELIFSVDGGQFTYELDKNRHTLLAKTPMDMHANGDVSVSGLHFGEARRYRLDDSYPWYGVHAIAEEHGSGVVVSLLGSDERTAYTLEARAYNNGAALRMTLPSGPSRIPVETLAFHPPAESEIWSFDPTESHYEGVYTEAKADALPKGRFMAPPVVIELPGHASYLAITEGRLENYPGMVLQSDGTGTYSVRPGNEVPADKALEYYDGADVARRLAVPAAISGVITTPWRIVMVASTLNDLVNNDIVSDVSNAPDPRLFPNGAFTSWIKPGRAAWTFLDGGERTPEGAKEVSRVAGELGFEYQVLEGQWKEWTEAQIKDVADSSRAHGIGMWLWMNRKDLSTQESRKEFFDLCNRTGVVGVKIDFFDSEAKEVVDLYQSMLRETAEHHLLVNFHGSTKPTGEQRTWPNELTREAIEGMEYCCIDNHPDAPRVVHAVTLPFTRLLAGPADYTPVLFDKGLNGTTWANQIASAVILTSPLLTFAANPATILANPAVDIIRSIPSVWDETVVLPPSRIGSLAIYARRHGKTWFLACMNGDGPQQVDVPLRFLESGSWQARTASDIKGNADAVDVQQATYTQRSTIHLTLVAGGGYVAQFTRQVKGGAEPIAEIRAKADAAMASDTLLIEQGSRF